MLKELESQLQSSEKMLKDSKENLKNLQADSKFLEQELRRLQMERERRYLQDALTIRRHFIECFKTDILKHPESQWSKDGRRGSISANHGDAVGDAFLFERDIETDVETYRQLYGFDYQQILRYCRI